MREPRRDHYLAPAADDDTDTVVESAIAALAKLRGMQTVADSATRLHLLASLKAETERRLPRVVADATAQGCSWAEIADLLGVTRASAWQRYARPTTTNPD
jgi:DNA-binding phage protein